MKYNRVLLKLSGEALAGDDKTGINAHTVADIARQIKDAKDLGVEIAIVCGGGDLWGGENGGKQLYGVVKLVLIWEWIVQVLTIWECWLL